MEFFVWIRSNSLYSYIYWAQSYIAMLCHFKVPSRWLLLCPLGDIPWSFDCVITHLSMILLQLVLPTFYSILRWSPPPRPYKITWFSTSVDGLPFPILLQRLNVLGINTFWCFHALFSRLQTIYARKGSNSVAIVSTINPTLFWGIYFLRSW